MRIHTELPDGVEAAPGVVADHARPRLHRFVEDRVGALARHGYAAAAPDLFHRQPADGADPTDMATIMTRIGRLRDDRSSPTSTRRSRTCGRWSAPPHGARGDRPCMGGRITYLAAGARPGTWRAAGVFYGGNIMKPWGDGPAPFDLTPRIDCPVIGFFGEDDANPSPADVDRIGAELTRHGKPHRVPPLRGRGPRLPELHERRALSPDAGRGRLAEAPAFLDRHLKAWIAAPPARRPLRVGRARRCGPVVARERGLPVDGERA